MSTATSDFIATAKQAKRLAELQAKATKIQNIDLAQAFVALGKSAYSDGSLRTEFASLFAKIDDEVSSPNEGRPVEEASTSSSLKDKVLAKASQVAEAGKQATRRVKAEILYKELGKAIFEKKIALPIAAAAIEKINSLIEAKSLLDSQINEINQAAKGRWITPKRMVFAAIAFVLLVVANTFVGENSKRPVPPGAEALLADFEEAFELTGSYSKHVGRSWVNDPPGPLHDLLVIDPKNPPAVRFILAITAGRKDIVSTARLYKFDGEEKKWVLWKAMGSGEFNQFPCSEPESSCYFMADNSKARESMIESERLMGRPAHETQVFLAAQGIHAYHLNLFFTDAESGQRHEAGSWSLRYKGTKHELDVAREMMTMGGEFVRVK